MGLCDKFKIKRDGDYVGFGLFHYRLKNYLVVDAVNDQWKPDCQVW